MFITACMILMRFGIGAAYIWNNYVFPTDNRDPKKRPTLEKFALDTSEVEKLLISKVKCFVDEPKMKVIDYIKKKTVLRENAKGEGKLDQRRSANKRLVEKGDIPNEWDSPNKVKNDTSNKQGVQRFDRELHSGYHDAQALFFRSLQAMDMLNLPSNIKLENGNLKRNGSKITTEEFCEVVDDITNMFVEKYSNKLIPFENTHMIDAYQSCETVCIKRFLMDMAVPNNLLEFKSYKIWRSHVLVYSCFAAFLYVYLDNTWKHVEK